MLYYDAIAESYNELYWEEQSKKIEIIKSQIEIKKGTKILDVGCGTGISSSFGCFVVGLDPSMELIKQNNKLKILGCAERLPFKDSSFDYVISVTAIHNFRNIKKSISEMTRVGREKFVFTILKKSGKIESIRSLLAKNFRIEKETEECKDTIFFCAKP